MAFTDAEIAGLTTMDSVEMAMGGIATDDQIAEAVERALRDASVTEAAAAVNFCTTWPVAELAMGFVKDILLKGGGWKAVLRWVLGKAITMGQKYHDAHCKARR